MHTQITYQPIKVVGVHAQQLRGLRMIVAARLKSPGQRASFGGIDGLLQIARLLPFVCRQRFANGLRKILRANGVAGAQHHRVFHCIFEFAHIARPAVGAQHRALREKCPGRRGRILRRSGRRTATPARQCLPHVHAKRVSLR